jgi:hypothetical protein
MKASVLTAVATLVPAILAAQANASSSVAARATTGAASATTAASSQATVAVPSNYSAESRAKIEAAFRATREKSLPEEAMRQRMAEGQAKGASEAQVVAAVQRAEARLQSSHSALIRAGRANPRPEEVSNAEQAMARGATEAQIEALARRAPADRSLTVALSVLSKLEARGQPVDQALAQVAAKLDARASDDAIMGLVNVGAAVGGKKR